MFMFWLSKYFNKGIYFCLFFNGLGAGLGGTTRTAEIEEGFVAVYMYVNFHWVWGGGLWKSNTSTD